MIETAKRYWANGVSFFVWISDWRRITVLVAASAIGAAMGMWHAADVVHPDTALVPTMRYLTAADLNEMKSVLLAQGATIADLRMGQKALVLELNARIEKLEALPPAITTGSIAKHGKR